MIKNVHFNVDIYIRCLIIRLLLLYFKEVLTYMDKNYLVKFGQRIRELRQKTGLSQEKFALMIGMDRTYFSSVESGKRNISLLNIKKIADGLEITVDKLFENL